MRCIMEIKISLLIENIDNNLKEIQENYRLGKFEFTLIASLVDKMLQLTNEISRLDRSELDLSEFNDKLNTMVNALEDKDYDYFLDIYNYDLKPLLDYWKDIIEK